MDLAILIPTLNEADNVARLIPTIESAVRELGLNYEIIVVDGGSTDNTGECTAKTHLKIGIRRVGKNCATNFWQKAKRQEESRSVLPDSFAAFFVW